MVVPGQLAFGGFLVSGGVLLAIDHPAVDRLNRHLKASGTSQRPSEIETDGNAELVGRAVGVLTLVTGLLIAVDAIARSRRGSSAG
ncbi:MULTISPECIES: hypothetical protein [Halolamina]|uniref:Uncharacterized protein n=1 Tax=Halolamina pelagica TaxID=699431 RepID=A0A1I5V6N7_9EURY|nr:MULTISPECIES: hypothetical protein [Halolamina]NHX37906.1 hypothetical protein [Halolamina sp. R1-12]SFQ03101.1 hypothetical protein SAMN05216277_11638 [Halolamina pelagica]